MSRPFLHTEGRTAFPSPCLSEQQICEDCGSQVRDNTCLQCGLVQQEVSFLLSGVDLKHHEYGQTAFYPRKRKRLSPVYLVLHKSMGTDGRVKSISPSSKIPRSIPDYNRQVNLQNMAMKTGMLDSFRKYFYNFIAYWVRYIPPLKSGPVREVEPHTLEYRLEETPFSLYRNLLDRFVDYHRSPKFQRLIMDNLGHWAESATSRQKKRILNLTCFVKTQHDWFMTLCPKLFPFRALLTTQRISASKQRDLVFFLKKTTNLNREDREKIRHRDIRAFYLRLFEALVESRQVKGLEYSQCAETINSCIFFESQVKNQRLDYRGRTALLYLLLRRQSILVTYDQVVQALHDIKYWITVTRCTITTQAYRLRKLLGL